MSDVSAFDGQTYEPGADFVRLSGQYSRVWEVMKDGKPRTLGEIARLTGDPEQSISARLRDFRKPKRGAHTVERERRGDSEAGVFEYRLIPNPNSRVDPGEVVLPEPEPEPVAKPARRSHDSNAPKSDPYREAVRKSKLVEAEQQMNLFGNDFLQ